MNPLATVRRARRGILSFLDELGAALGEESAVHRLFTIHNELVSLTATIDYNPCARDAGYRLSWHMRSADEIIRGSGGLADLQTPDEATAAWNAAGALYVASSGPEEFRRRIRADVEAVRSVQGNTGRRLK